LGLWFLRLDFKVQSRVTAVFVGWFGSFNYKPNASLKCHWNWNAYKMNTITSDLFFFFFFFKYFLFKGKFVKFIHRNHVKPKNQDPPGRVDTQVMFLSKIDVDLQGMVDTQIIFLLSYRKIKLFGFCFSFKK
jgi:hypothetical protein